MSKNKINPPGIAPSAPGSRNAEPKKRIRTEIVTGLDEELVQLGIHLWDEIAKGIAQKMPEQLIPVVNECCHKTYPPDAKITFLSTEYVRPRSKDGHAYPVILSDITFQIDGREIYHIEFQINDDKTIAIRMLEYDFQIGLQHGSSLSEDHSGLTVQFPHSTVIYPFGGQSLPDEMTCTLRFQDGTAHTYKIPVVRISDYALSELFRKKLNMFLPFSLLRFRNRLNSLKLPSSKISAENSLKKELTAFLEELIMGLETELNQGILSEWQYNEILRLVNMAVSRVFHEYSELRKEAAEMTECKLKFFSDYAQEWEEERAQMKAELSEKEAAISEKDAEISEKDATISEKDAAISEMEAELSALKQQIAELKGERSAGSSE